MSVLARIALGFAVLRGFMLTALTVPWLVQKIRRADATELERSLVLMVASRTILLGIWHLGAVAHEPARSVGVGSPGRRGASALRRSLGPRPAQADPGCSTHHPVPS
jgi:hypothetical protein